MTASIPIMGTPGSGFVRVLATVKTDGKSGWLSRIAEKGIKQEPLDRGDIDRSSLPDDFVIDPSFYAVPLGPNGPGETNFARDEIKLDFADPNALAQTLGLYQPQRSQHFLIRGFVRSDAGESVPAKLGRKGGLELIFHSDPSTGVALVGPTDKPVGTIMDAQVRLGVPQLQVNGLDGQGVAVAVVDSGIFRHYLEAPQRLTRHPEQFPLPHAPALDIANSWRPSSVATPPGSHRLGHGTMCAYNLLAVAPKATLLDYPSLIARPPGDHSVKGTIGSASAAFGLLLQFWIANLLRGTSAPYRALVVNNSWTIVHPCEEDFAKGQQGRYIDDSNHPFHLLIWILAQLGVDVVFAAGNGGLPSPTPEFLHLTAGSIRGACAYPEVLTVAGCDVTDLRVGYSSQGPAIAMSPPPTPDKPDIAAYTHFLGSQVFGPRAADGGTSTAAPIAAGCIAALRTKRPATALSSKSLFDALRQTARSGKNGGPGGTWNKDYGYGIIDPVKAAQRLNLLP